jgi:chorismate-pyruvate lyase
MLNFANYAKIVNNAIKETDEKIVNLLLGCIYIPLELKNNKGETFYIDKATASHYLNPKSDRTVHREIILGSGSPVVIASADKYFDETVSQWFIEAMKSDMISELVRVITYDATISKAKKNELLELADKKTLAKFLASVLLYSVNKPNIIFESVTEHSNLPERNRHFSGRVEQLENINKMFKKKENNAVSICQTVLGLGGVGKTQLSIEYAYRYCSDFKNCIWFVNAETTTTTQNYFMAFANHFNIKLPLEHKPEDLQIAVKLWLSENKEWLLIFDNLESADTIKSYLPDKINGRMIITTRNTRIDFGKQVSLGVFDMDEALTFIKKRLSDDEDLKLERYNKNDNDFDVEAPKLAERLGFLPLALEQAVAYIKEVKCTITKYLKLLGESGLSAFEEGTAAPEHYVKSNDFEKIVTATWNISFNAVACEGSRQLLNLCAYMAPDRIPVSFFADMREMLPSPIKEDMGSEITKNRIVRELSVYSLTSGDADYINVHRLVQEVVRRSHVEDAK